MRMIVTCVGTCLWLPLLSLLGGCGDQQPGTSGETEDKPATAAILGVESGMFFKPPLEDFVLYNESEGDGDGDGVNETHIRRYINQQGDTAFSMTTGAHLWAWSLATRNGDTNDIHSNYVIRDSNCDGVFDERYSLDAEFRIPACIKRVEAGEAPQERQQTL